MAHEPIDTLGMATRHNMLVKAECSCGNVRYRRSVDLMMVYGGRFDPLKLKFNCSRWQARYQDYPARGAS